MANPPLRDQFADAFPDFGPAGTRVDQQGARSSKQKIEKRLLVIRAAGLADDVKILVVSMDVEFRHSRTASCAGGPTIRQHAQAKTQIGWWDFGNCFGTSAQQYAYGSETNQQATDHLGAFHGKDVFQSYWIDLQSDNGDCDGNAGQAHGGCQVPNCGTGPNPYDWQISKTARSGNSTHLL